MILYYFYWIKFRFCPSVHENPCSTLTAGEAEASSWSLCIWGSNANLSFQPEPKLAICVAAIFPSREVIVKARPCRRIGLPGDWIVQMHQFRCFRAPKKNKLKALSSFSLPMLWNGGGNHEWRSIWQHNSKLALSLLSFPYHFFRLCFFSAACFILYMISKGRLSHWCIFQGINLIQQGLGAVVGALSRNLADLHERQGSYLSIYDQPSATPKVSHFIFVIFPLHYSEFFYQGKLSVNILIFTIAGPYYWCNKCICR